MQLSICLAICVSVFVCVSLTLYLPLCMSPWFHFSLLYLVVPIQQSHHYNNLFYSHPVNHYYTLLLLSLNLTYLSLSLSVSLSLSLSMQDGYLLVLISFDTSAF